MATTITANGINFPDGSASAPSIGGTDTNTGLFTGSDIVGFATGGTERLRIESDGKITIGNHTGASHDIHIKHANSPGIRIEDTTNTVKLTMFAQDSNSGIANFSDHALLLYTNSLERLRVHSNGNVTIGSASFDTGNFGSVQGLNVYGTQPLILVNATGNGTSFFMGKTSNTCYLGTSDAQNINFRVSDADKMILDSSGRLLLGTTTEGFSSGDDLTIATSSHTGITIRSGTTSEGAVYFSDATSGAAEYIASLVYSHNTNAMMLTTNGSERLRITSTGNIETKGHDGQCFKFNSDWSTGARNVQIWNSDQGAWHSFIGTNLTYDGTNYIKPSDAASSNWGNIAGIVFEGSNVGGNPAIRFIVDLPAENGLNYSLGTSKSTAIDNKTVAYFTPNKDFVINDGNLVIGTSGHGIDFSATSDASGKTGELLDDYEEGTWNQTSLYLGDHTKHGDSHANYTKVGNLVTATFFYKWTSRSTNNGAYGVKVTMPFTSATLVLPGVGSCACESISLNNSDRTSFHTSVYSNTNLATFRASKHNNSEISFNGAISTSASAGYFAGTVTYRVP